MSIFPEKLLIRRYALQADLWSIQRESEELLREIRPRQEQLDRIRTSGGPYRGSKGLQWEELHRELSPFKERLKHLRDIESHKRTDLTKLETELRRIFRAMSGVLTLADQQHAEADRVAQSVTQQGDHNNDSTSRDLFISHATEDKDSLVRQLVTLLRELGIRVWYDEYELKVGDSLRRSLDRGLTISRFGVVVISRHFIRKQWTQYELDSLVAREIHSGKVILPIWHDVTKDEVMEFSPKLVDKVALNTSTKTVPEIALEIAIAIHQPISHGS